MSVDGGKSGGRAEPRARDGRPRGTSFAIALGIAAVVAVTAASLLVFGTRAPLGPGATPTGPPVGISTAAVPSGVRTPGPGAGATNQPGNVALPGSPEVVLFQRQGDDLDVVGWRAGEPGLGTRHVLSGALAGIADQQDPMALLSPDGSLVLVKASPTTPDAGVIFRAFRLESSGGRSVLDTAALGSGVTAGFISPDQAVVTPGSQVQTDLRWSIVDLAGDSSVVHELKMPRVPRQAPGASIDVNTVIFNYVPFAISADRSGVYVMSVHASDPQLRPAYRISVATGEAEPIHDLPRTGPLRAVSGALDPISGRLLLAGPYWTSAAGLVEAWSTGAERPDLKAELNHVFGAVWLDDDGVLTADYDRLPGPFTFRILTLTSTGEPAATLFSATGTDAALLGARSGFAAAYVTTRGSNLRKLLVIRLADGAISAVNVPEPSGILGSPGMRP